MVLQKIMSLDGFLDDIAFGLWTKDHSGTLSLSGRRFGSAVNVTVNFKWTYNGSVNKIYEDGFSYDHEDKPKSDEMRNVASELKSAENKLIKKGVVALYDGKSLKLKVADGFPSGLAADLLHVPECKLIVYGKDFFASGLFEQARRHNRNERQVYDNICAYFAKR